MSMKIEEINPSNNILEKVDLPPPPPIEEKEEIPQTLEDLLPKSYDTFDAPQEDYCPPQINKLFGTPKINDSNIIGTPVNKDNNMTKYLLGAGVLFTLISGIL